MPDWPVVGVAGARGLVGGVFLSILADAGLPAGSLPQVTGGDLERLIDPTKGQNADAPPADSTPEQRKLSG